MVKLSTIPLIFILLIVSIQITKAQDLADFKAHLYKEKQYRELALLLQQDSMSAEAELVAVLVAQGLTDSAYLCAKRLPASAWNESSDSLRTALGILYSDSVLLFAQDRQLDTCRTNDNISSWQFINGHSQGLRFCSTHLQSEYQYFASYQYKKPLVAGMLSAAVPGLGKVYTGYPNQFWSSFLPTIFLAAAVAESSRNGWTSPRFIGTAAVFSVFYTGNIWGSISLANKHNNHAKDSFTNTIELHYRAMLRNK